MKRNLLKTLFAGLFLTVLTPLTTSADVAINEINFPDMCFRDYLLRQEYGRDGIITDSEISSITEIRVEEKSIYSLKGIEYFTALTMLMCYNNPLDSLDVSNNKALTTLSCYNNRLTSLDVSQNTALTWLECSYNQLTSLDVSQNAALDFLSCSGNPLTSLDVSKNTALTTLSCNKTPLTSLDVSRNTALKRLSCYDNPLTSLDVSKNTALTTLSCYKTLLTSLDVSKNTALETLECYSNRLTSLDVSGCTALYALLCNDNQLTSLDVSGCTALGALFCNDNKLTSLNASVCSTTLHELSCENNQLTSLDVSGCELAWVWCYQNQIKGDSMDAFIEGLPGDSTTYIKRQLRIYAPGDNEGNVCTQSQVAAMKEKGWIPYYYDYDYQQWMPYEGCDDDDDDPSTIDPSGIAKPIVETENANTPAYNLSGQKVASAKKGIYIVNGHKVVIK